MSGFEYGMADFHSIAAGAVVLAGGGGGSYQDALAILQQLADSGWRGTGALWVVNGDGAGRAASFAGLLRNTGYAGAMPSAC